MGEMVFGGETAAATLETDKQEDLGPIYKISNDNLTIILR